MSGQLLKISFQAWPAARGTCCSLIYSDLFGCAGQIASPRLISLSTRVAAQEGIAQFQMFASTTSPRAGTTDDPGLKGVAD